MTSFEQATKTCPFCAEQIHSEAIKCKHCGEFLNENRGTTVAQPAYATQIVHNYPAQRKWSPGVAAVLSFFIPGVGQMYKGNVLAGILWLVVVPIGYVLLIVPGLVLHLICIVTAASGDPYK